MFIKLIAQFRLLYAGAVTVDWMVLTAVVVTALAIVVVPAIYISSTGAAEYIRDELLAVKAGE